jgi:RNA polymerase sigma-70 factor (ECF subfamily)
MIRLADGDRRAFEPLYQGLWPELRRVCVATMGPTDGEDCAQQALLNIFSRAAEFDPSRDALAWAVGIAVWECRTVRRRAHRRGEAKAVSPESVPLAAAGQDPEAEVSQRELGALATELLATLAPADVEAIMASLAGDQDAAVRLGLKPATFRKRLERALGRLRDGWRSKHEHS